MDNKTKLVKIKHLAKGDKYKVKEFNYPGLYDFKCPYFRKELNTIPEYTEIGNDIILTFDRICYCSVQNLGVFATFIINIDKEVYLNYHFLDLLVEI